MSHRPKDTDFVQQRMKPVPAKFPSFYISIAIIVLGIIFLPIGTNLRDDTSRTYEKKIEYDDGDGGDDCYISRSNEAKTCLVTFTFDADKDGPFYLYYHLTSFYQNHRRYYTSRDVYQLQGERLGENDVKLSCNPLYKNGSQLLNPCGLIANSFFNDQYSVYQSSKSSVSLDESGISLRSDRDELFKQVDGFTYAKVSDSADLSCEEALHVSSDCHSYTDPKTGESYYYYYPDDSSVQYLHESYPDQISPIDGVTDEHFIVWMRVQSMPTFRKLYATINTDFKAGDFITINITANYAVGSYNEVKKSLLLSNLGALGGKNYAVSDTYMTIGSISLTIGVALLLVDLYVLYRIKPS